MKRTPLGSRPCSIAKALDVIGEWWTPLILRDLLITPRKFDDLRAKLGVSSNILADRLLTLVNGGVVERRLYSTGPDRYEYHLTDSGRALIVVIGAIQEWGDTWASPSDQPYGVVTHGPGQHAVHTALVCEVCGEIPASEGQLRPGPAFQHAWSASEPASA